MLGKQLHDPLVSGGNHMFSGSSDEARESFCIRDANGQALAYVYTRMSPVAAWRLSA